MRDSITMHSKHLLRTHIILYACKLMRQYSSVVTVIYKIEHDNSTVAVLVI